ncbi:MAG: hypothetical protein ABSD70_18190, partial [Terracidiphilus sp.]
KSWRRGNNELLDRLESLFSSNRRENTEPSDTQSVSCAGAGQAFPVAAAPFTHLEFRSDGTRSLSRDSTSPALPHPPHSERNKILLHSADYFPGERTMIAASISSALQMMGRPRNFFSSTFSC